MIRHRVATLGSILLAAATAVGQDEYVLNRYESQYGQPVDVSLSDLVMGGSAYEGRAVRTKGNLSLETIQTTRVYLLRDNMGNKVFIYPVPDLSGDWDFNAMKMLGGEVEVTGVFASASGASSMQQGLSQGGGVIQFWKYLGPPEENEKLVSDAATLSLETLVARAARMEGKTVRVAGQFRGRNLFGDLPASSEKSRADWVIKDDVYSVWVTGKKPKGSGWALDPSLKRDTGKWIEVIGRVETRGNYVYLRAVKVMPGAPPKPDSKAQAPAPPPEKPKVPPIVVFALPLDGEAEVPPQSRFVVQFSKDMDEATFKGRVVLRYVGRLMPGDRELDGVTISYDGGRRALTVDPGDVLRNGRQMELLLLPGIVDVDGLALEPRPGRAVGVAVDVLRYRIGG